MSIVPALGGIALELPWDLDEDLAFKPLSKNNDVYGCVPHVFDLKYMFSSAFFGCLNIISLWNLVDLH
jgi:hypothetical protein